MDRARKSGRGGVRFMDPFPKYLQIREILVRRIERTMRIGDRLPTEHQLRTEFGVSRETVREALSGLETDGIIVRTPGQGTFVAALPPSRGEARLTGLSEDFSRFKLDTTAVVLATGEVVPETAIAQSLDLQPGQPAFRIYRRRHVDGRPFSLHEAFLPTDVGRRVAAFDLQCTSVVDVLERRLKLPIREHLQTIEAVAADTESAQQLGVGIGGPLLQVVRHFKLTSGVPVVCFRSLYRSDRYFYTVALSQRVPPDEDGAANAVPAMLQGARKRRRAPALADVEPPIAQARASPGRRHGAKASRRGRTR